MRPLLFHYAQRGQHGSGWDCCSLIYMKSGLVKAALLIAIVVVVMLLLVSSCGNRQENDVRPSPDATPSASPQTTEPSPDATPSAEPTVSPEPTPAESTPPEDEPSPTPDVSTRPDPTPTPTVNNDPQPTTRPVTQGSTAPYAESVDDEWFSDAAFLGNSLVDGFRLFSGLTTCDVYAATSMTVMGAGNLISQMNAKQYGKVYILLGINEIGYDADYFKTQYSNMLDTIIAGQPDADIYIMGLTPISEAKSTTDSTFTMDRVRTYNEKLLELAVEKGCYYIDLCEALSDETGYLPASVTTDGIHFSASHYLVWLEYLRTHHA